MGKDLIKEEVFREYKKTGNIDLRNKIIETYLPFAKKIASKILSNQLKVHKKHSYPYGFFSFKDKNNLKDYEQLAGLGLIDAVERYDPDKGVDFKNYAFSRIRGEIFDSVRAFMFVPKKAYKILKQKEEHIPKLMRFPVDWEEETKPRRILEDIKSLDPYKKIERRDSIAFFLNNGFSKRDYAIFTDYELEELTLREAGERNRVKESRACQIHSAIMKEIKQEIEEKNYDFKDFN